MLIFSHTHTVAKYSNQNAKVNKFVFTEHSHITACKPRNWLSLVALDVLFSAKEIHMLTFNIREHLCLILNLVTELCIRYHLVLGYIYKPLYL